MTDKYRFDLACDAFYWFRVMALENVKNGLHMVS